MYQLYTSIVKVKPAQMMIFCHSTNLFLSFTVSNVFFILIPFNYFKNLTIIIFLLKLFLDMHTERCVVVPPEVREDIQ